MNEIKETINTLRTCCDTIDQVNTNLVGAYQQLEQLLSSLEKYVYKIYCRANDLAESWIRLWKNVSSEVKPYLNRHSNIIIPPKIQLIEEQPPKAQRVTTEVDTGNLEEEEEEQIEIEEIKPSRKKRNEEINVNTTESKRRKGNSGKRGRK